MPYAEISLNKDLFSEEEKEGIADKLTKILIEAEGLVDNTVSRALALIDIKEFDNLYVGGKKEHQDKIVVKVFAFEEAFSNEAKIKLYRDITNTFIECSEQIKAQNGNNVWCMIFPLQSYNFGVGGNPVSLEITRNFVSSYEKR